MRTMPMHSWVRKVGQPRRRWQARGASQPARSAVSLSVMKRGVLVLCILLGACRDPAGPAPSRVTLAILGSDVIYAPAGVPLPEPLQVIAADAVTKRPAREVSVEWRVVAGSASLNSTATTTNEFGVAGTTPTASAIGSYRVRATSDRIVGEPPEFEVRVIAAPLITAIAPSTITAGDTVTVTGSNFSPTASDNAVLFDGVRGHVVAATATQLRVVVPLCLPQRQTSVRVALGFVSSPAVAATANAASGTFLELQPGQARTFVDPAEVACIRLPGGLSNSMYLITAHNVGDALFAPVGFELRGLTRQGVIAAVAEQPAAAADFAWSFEQALRARERAFAAQPSLPAIIAAAPVPNVGDTREFSVLDTDNKFVKINAVARVVTTRAILYVDAEAQSAFTAADLNRLGALFDDPIYPTEVAVFGEVSDIDANQRVMILFTPRVNMLTPRGENTFVAGYFYGCDLVARSRCSGTNSGEVFYSLVPDPTGKWADARSVSSVLLSVPPVLAHELQHMIHFSRRGFTTDALWLSEGLAQTAEEIVGDVFQTRGETALAATMKNGNYSRAGYYLASTQSTSLLAEAPPGTIEQRGAAWLFLKYVRGHYGENDLLRRLTNSTRSSVSNITAETGGEWNTLLTNFGIALWADRAPELRGTLDTRYTFRNFDLRASLSGFGGYPLRPTQLQWQDFSTAGTLPTASQAYYTLTAPNSTSAPPINFVFSGPRGAAFAPTDRTQLTILRAR
jgi:hypothetical protein